MFSEPATAYDRRWWLDLAPTLKWSWASTFKDFAPHWYVVEGKTPGLSREDFVRAGRVIRTFGEAGRFYKRTNLYLFTEDRRLKFWAMWGQDPSAWPADIINVATADQVYGPQRDFDMARVAELRIPPFDPKS